MSRNEIQNSRRLETLDRVELQCSWERQTEGYHAKVMHYEGIYYVSYFVLCILSLDVHTL
jgi:hypothetical protein